MTKIQKEIVDAFNGSNQIELARRFNTSTAFVYRVLAEARTTATYTAPSKLVDGFRRALDVLIATAPGTAAEIQHEVQDALRAYSQQGPIQSVNKQESRLAGHLMMLGFSQVNKAPQPKKPASNHDSLGFKSDAAVLGNKPRTQLAIRDVDALSVEDMRLIIQNVLRRQSLEHAHSLVEADGGSAADKTILDTHNLPSTTLANRAPGLGSEHSADEGRRFDTVGQPEGSGLLVMQSPAINEAVEQPSSIRAEGDIQPAGDEVGIALNINSRLSDGDLEVHGKSSQ